MLLWDGGSKSQTKKQKQIYMLLSPPPGTNYGPFVDARGVCFVIRFLVDEIPYCAGTADWGESFIFLVCTTIYAYTRRLCTIRAGACVMMLTVQYTLSTTVLHSLAYITDQTIIGSHRSMLQ